MKLIRLSLYTVIQERITVAIDELAVKLPEILDTIQKDMLERARAHRDAHTYVAVNYDEFKGSNS